MIVVFKKAMQCMAFCFVMVCEKAIGLIVCFRRFGELLFFACTK